MQIQRQREYMRSRTITEPVDPIVLEFARRHQISPAVAKAILIHAQTPDDADRAVAKMRGE